MNKIKLLKMFLQTNWKERWEINSFYIFVGLNIIVLLILLNVILDSVLLVVFMTDKDNNHKYSTYINLLKQHSKIFHFILDVNLSF